MKKKDLLILCQYFYPDAASTSRLPTELAEDLCKKGLTIDAICGYPSYIKTTDSPVPKYEKYNGIGIYRLKYPIFNKNKTLGRLLNYFSFSFLVLLKIFQFKKYENILIVSNPPLLPFFGFLSTKLFRNNFYYLIYDLYPDIAIALGAIGKDSLMAKVMNFINNCAFGTVKNIISIGDDMKQYLLNNKPQLRSEQITVIPNWVDSKKIKMLPKDSQMQNELGLANKFVVMYSGNIGLFQDLEMIIEAAEKLSNIKDLAFVFTGEGGKKAKLINMVNERKLENVKFFGYFPDEIYDKVLSCADCLVVTLEKSAEGLGVPSKTYTYLASGKPLLGILSENTDIGKMIESENIGFRVNQDEVSEFTDAILKLYNDKELSSKMGAKARSLLESKYDRSIATQKYFNLFKT